MADTNRPVAIITGASSGIGASYALRLAEMGYDPVIVARRRDRLQDLAREVQSRWGATAEVIAGDLCETKTIGDVAARASQGDVDMLVNNAGFAGYRPFIDLYPKVAENLMTLQVRVPTLLIRAVLPGMVQRRRGGVVNVASLLALSATIPPNPMPHRAVYAGAKSYLLTFTQALAGELRDTGVQLQALLPGVVATEFHNDLRMDPGRLAAMAMQPDQVVAASLVALERGELICVPGLDDPSLLDNLGKAQRAIMEAANRPHLAARYTTAIPSR
jgi:short-subunit dehydrogenase